MNGGRTWSGLEVAALRRVLADLFPRESDQRRFVADLGLEAATISFEPKAANAWFDILSRARQAGLTVEAVIRCALNTDEGRANGSLQRLLEDYELLAPSASELEKERARELGLPKQDPEKARAVESKGLGAADGSAAPGLIAIGPEVIVVGRVIRTVRRLWTVEVDKFVLGDLTDLRHFADSFTRLPTEERYACVQAHGVGRLLVEGPAIDLTSDIVVELQVDAPLPLGEARRKFDANLRGLDIALDLSGDEPDLDPMFTEISGADTIAQTLCMYLSACKGGYCAGGEHGSRVAELYPKLGPEYIADVIAIETIRLATVPHRDDVSDRTFIPFDFVKRVRGVKILPSTSEEFLKAAISLDVHGVGDEKEFVVPISTSTGPLGPPPLPPSLTMTGP